MFHLTYELQCMIMSFLPNDNLHPVSKESQQFYLSNVVWKPRVLRRYSARYSSVRTTLENIAGNCMLERRQFWYKRQWTLGCVGRVVALKKPTFLPAVI